MKTTLEYYDIFPKILCTEREAEITIVHWECMRHLMKKRSIG